MKITAKHIQAIEDFLNESEPEPCGSIAHITGTAKPTMVRYLIRVVRCINTLEAIFYDNEGERLPYFQWIIA